MLPLGGIEGSVSIQTSELCIPDRCGTQLRDEYRAIRDLISGLSDWKTANLYNSKNDIVRCA